MELHLNERELYVEGIIKDAWQIFKRHLPVLLPSIILYIILGFTVDTFWHILFRYHRKGHFLGHQLFNVTSNVLRDFIIISLILIADNAIKGEAVTFKETIKKTCGFWPSSIWANFLALLIILGMLLLIVVPGIVWAICLYFVTYAVVLQGKKGKAALNYSKSLVKGNWWKILFISFVFGALTIAPYTCTVIFYKIFHNELGFSSVMDRLPLELVLISCLFGSFVYCFTIIANVVLFRNIEYLKYISEPVEKPMSPLDLIPTFGKDNVAPPRYIDHAGE